MGDAEVVDWSTGEICEKVDSTVEAERIKVEHILKNGGMGGGDDGMYIWIYL